MDLDCLRTFDRTRAEWSVELVQILLELLRATLSTVIDPESCVTLILLSQAVMRR